MQRACQLMKEEMQSTHQLQMEMQRACQLMKEEIQSTHQLQRGMQRIRQREEEAKLKGSSGMSWKEEGIGCGSSAVQGLPRPAEGTHGCMATEDRTEFLSLRAKGYPLTWRLEMSEVRSGDCEGRGERTEEASGHRKQEQRLARLVAMLVGSSSRSIGGLIRRKEAIRGEMDEQPLENVMTLVGQWRPAAKRPPPWPPPDEDNPSRGAMPRPREVCEPEAWLAAVQKRKLCQTSWHWETKEEDWVLKSQALEKKMAEGVARAWRRT
jgi:hypothetical protein